SAADRLQPMLVADELLARASRTGVGRLRLLDPAPVVIVGGHDAAACKQALEALRALFVSCVPRGHRGGDLVGHFIAVGPVGPDGAARTAPRPAYGEEPVRDASPFVDELAAFERHVGDRRAGVADGGYHQRCGNLVSLAGAPRGAFLVKFGALDDNP